MWHKRQRDIDPEAPAGKRLRDNILDLYGSGELAADRTQDLLEDAAAFAHEAGRDDMQDLRRRTSAGSEREVRMWNTKEKVMGKSKVCLLLPHEILHCLAEIGDFEVLTDATGLDAANRERHGAILQAP